MNACYETSTDLNNQAPAMTGYAIFVNHMKDCEAKACELVAGPDSNIDRLDDVLYEFKALARKRGLSQDATIRDCIRGLEALNKQLRISISGQNNENRVAYSISFADRDDFESFRNVYLSNGVQETELDNVVVTNNGILIIEIKGTKSDITITEEGRIMRGTDECFDNTPIGEKMEIKKDLLNEKIQQALQEKGVDIPLHIETQLVFSAPKGLQYKISDQYKKVPCCRSGKIQFIVKEFTSEVHYTDEQLTTLKETLRAIPTCKKQFDSTFNPDATIELLTKAMKLLSNEPITEKSDSKVVERGEQRVKEKIHIYEMRKNARLRYFRVASAVVGFLVVPFAGALVFASTGLAGFALKKAQ